MSNLPRIEVNTGKVTIKGTEIEFREILTPEYEVVTAIEKINENKELSLDEKTSKQYPLVKELLASCLNYDSSIEEKRNLIDTFPIKDLFPTMKIVLSLSGLKGEEIDKAVKEAEKQVQTTTKTNPQPKKKS